MTVDGDHRAALERVHDLLAELADLIGPAYGATLDEIDVDDLPTGSVFLGEWAAVLSWVDETGEAFLTRISSVNLLGHHRDGLFHQGLYGFG